MTLGIVTSDLDSTAKAFSDLNVAQIEVDTLTQAVKDLKISADKKKHNARLTEKL
jgi:hypothetical protein